MALAPGTRLGPYEVAGALGVGGMGEVYKARDTRLDRTVAIKILPSGDLDRRERFAREAKTGAPVLQGPNRSRSRGPHPGSLVPQRKSGSVIRPFSEKWSRIAGELSQMP